MSNELRTEYKGYPIDYNEAEEKFRAFVDGMKAFESTSLKALKDQIDDFEKYQNKKDFLRFKVLVLQDTYGLPYKFIVGEVTSITGDGNYWVSAGGNRRKEVTIIPFSDDNNTMALKMVTLKEEEVRLNKERFELNKSLKRLSKGARP